MLEAILSNFSMDELISFLPRGAVDFALKVTNEDDELDKSGVVKVVSNTCGIDFIVDKRSRKLLIERMLPEALIELFPEFKLEGKSVEPRHYDAVISWSENNVGEFAKRIGLYSDYVESQFETTDIETIFRVEPSYGLFPYQKKISDTVIDRFSGKTKRLLIHLPTGAGKTRTAMNIVAEHLRESPNNLVLWLADKEELCQQAFDEFKKAWGSCGDRPCTVYGFYADSDESLSGIDSGCVVAGLHKLLSIKKKDSNQLKLLYGELRSKVSLVVFDEAHKAIADKYGQITEEFVNFSGFESKLIGLSATPGRRYSEAGPSDEDKALSLFFDENKVSMDVPGYLSPIDYLVENKFLAKATFMSINYEHSKVYGYELKGCSAKETNKALSRNNDRNKTIVEIIKKECAQGSRIILFACNVEHAQKMAVVLNYLGIKAASIDSKLDSVESRRSKIKRYKSGDLQVLTNYGVLTAGFDAPKTNVAIIAKPTTSLVEYLQMAGRAMRGAKSHGNEECRVYTVVDHIPEFNSISMAFEYWNEMWSEG